LLYSIHKNTDPTLSLSAALNDLQQIIVHRMQTHFNQQTTGFDKWLRDTFGDRLIRTEMIRHLPAAISTNEWIALLLSLVPHVQPNFFESIIAEHLPNGGDFAEFGGVKGSNHRSILPTGETVQFVLAGTDLEQRLQVHQLFGEEHFFYRHGILWLEPVKEGEPVMSGRIVMAQDWVDKILFDKESAPRFGLDFPAKRIDTNMIWDDVVLNRQTRTYVNEISDWLQLHHLFSEDENLKRKIKPGYRVLFYGPSGTGKTLTAALLGKQFQKDVYRVDLSQVVSKYIGETEKNLEGVFKKAETKNWILFFDEADALFGKRTNMQSAHDKYANQEVSYLLQRVEDFPGLMILATNFKSNLDDAFLRRFHSLIHFPMPNSAERLLLWQRSMPTSLERDADIKLEEIAKQFEISGASILNAVQYAALQTYARNNGVICQQDLIDGIRKEYQKEDKSF